MAGLGRGLLAFALVSASLAYCFFTLRLHLLFPGSSHLEWVEEIARHIPVKFRASTTRPASLKSFDTLIQEYKGQRTKYSRHIVAVGDLHGDLPNARRVLKFSDVIDEFDNWSGHVDFFVQTGDIIDR